MKSSPFLKSVIPLYSQIACAVKHLQSLLLSAFATHSSYSLSMVSIVSFFSESVGVFPHEARKPSQLM